MDYTINKHDLDDRINGERISNLFREHNIAVSGLKYQLWARMEEAINGKLESKTLTAAVVDSFIAEEISHGRNKTLFISSFPSAHANQLKKIEYVKSCLTRCGYTNERFNNLRTVTQSEETLLSFCDYKLEGGLVKQVSLCFTKNVVKDEVDEELAFKGKIEYIWVEILPFEQRLITKVWLRSNNSLENQQEGREIYDEISLLVREMFSLAPVDVSWQKSTLYKIFESLTRTAERPYREKVSLIRTSIDELVGKCSEQLGINTNQLSIDLPYRIVRLFERSLIEQDYESYKEFSKGKLGYIERIFFSDSTGASVRARSAANKGLEMADIYFDTRDTIEQLKNLSKIWVTWFYKDGQDATVDKVDTRIEVFKEHFIIHFTRTYTTKEVEQFVLSNFRQFENVQNR